MWRMSFTPPSDPQPPSGQPQPQFGLQPQEDNDKLVATLSYVFPILASLIILVTDMKNKPFLKYHAYQSLVLGIALTIGWIIASVLTVVLVGCILMPVLLVVQFYYAYLAYSRGIFTIPLITNLTGQLFKDFPIERPGMK